MKFILVFFLSLSTVFAYGQSETECKKVPNSVRISFVGDILLHKYLYDVAIKKEQKFKYLWSDLLQTLSSPDLTVGNLEGPVAPGTAIGGKQVADPGLVHDGIVYSGTKFVFNFHPQSLVDISQSGFDFLTLANNHTLDRGSVGVDKTIVEIKKTNLGFTGVRSSLTNDRFEKVISVKGIKIGLIGCTEMTNGWKDTKSQLLLCKNPEMLSIISKLKIESDFVVVMPHWGDEYKWVPNSTQKNWARSWVAAGANLIIGSHPHVLQSTEWIAKSFVAYSLGNFVAAQKNMDRSTSAVVHFDLRKNKDKTEIVQYSYTPFMRPPGSVQIRKTTLISQFAISYQHAQKQLGAIICEK